eukprot:scaffold77731_cov51-Phaeocystis_antarctica.AAC.1
MLHPSAGSSGASSSSACPPLRCAVSSGTSATARTRPSAPSLAPSPPPLSHSSTRSESAATATDDDGSRRGSGRGSGSCSPLHLRCVARASALVSPAATCLPPGNINRKRRHTLRPSSPSSAASSSLVAVRGSPSA